jgi:hypothetical protein
MNKQQNKKHNGQLALRKGTSPAVRDNNNGSRTRVKSTRWHATFIQALRKSPNITAACHAAHVNRTTAYRHREDESFAAKWDEALDASVDKVEETAFRMANEGDSGMIQFVLKAFRGERYRETSRLEIDQRFCGVLVVPDKENKDP